MFGTILFKITRLIRGPNLIIPFDSLLVRITETKKITTDISFIGLASTIALKINRIHFSINV